MIDITAQIQSFIAGRLTWSTVKGRDLAKTIASASGGTLDWDQDAGEGWARVLRDKQPVALICMLGSLVILIGSGTSEMAKLTEGFPVIAVPSFDAPVLTCQPETLREAFGDGCGSSGVI